MRVHLLLASLLVLACGETRDPGPMSRRTDNPIERRMQELTPERAERERPVAAVVLSATPAPVAEPSAAATPPASRPAPEPVAEARPEPAAEPAPQPDPQPTRSRAVSLTRAVVAQAIEGREPSGLAPIPASAERVFLFLEAANEGEAEATLEVEWIAPDGTRGEPIALEVPVAPRWRTWATTSRARGQVGAWTVVVREGDAELHRSRFDVTADPAAAS